MPETRLVSSSYARLALIVSAGFLFSACGSDSGIDTDEQQAKQAQLKVLSNTYADASVASIQSLPEAMQLGRELFEMHCADCHGADGAGAKGITDLTLGRYNYGTSADAIRTTIRDGRLSEMPRMGRDYGEVELGQIVAYLETLTTGQPPNDYEARGQQFYLASCAACHGEDGTGQAALGAPDLTDDYWQHGESMMNIRLAITRGVKAACPPHGESLSGPEIELLTAWIRHLSAD